jgi:HEAT repeat protein
MDELNSNASPLPPDEDLTEVRKPTSLLIAQFFLFPLIIIGICVGIFLFFGYLFFGTAEQKTPAQYLQNMRSGNGTQRWQAAYELSNLVKSNPQRANTPEFVESLAAAYKDTADEDILVRGFLAQIFGEFKERSAVPLLSEGLRRDERLKTANWDRGGILGLLTPSLDQIREELVQAQIYTLFALGSIGDNSAVPVVLEFGKNQEASVRKVAAWVLGSFKDPQAVEVLRVLLNDPVDDVRWNAAIALAQLNNSEGAELLMKLIDHSYVDTLPNMTASCPQWRTQCEDPRAVLMANAVTALGILRHEPAREKIRALSENEPALGVRKAALEALKKY